MREIVVVDAQGSIQLPRALLDAVKPHTRFVLEVQGETIILRRITPFWLTATPQERAERFGIRDGWSGRRDSNPRPQRPKRCALPDCATPRQNRFESYARPTGLSNGAGHCQEPQAGRQEPIHLFNIQPSSIVSPRCAIIAIR